jgi:hypothetical protein
LQSITDTERIAPLGKPANHFGFDPIKGLAKAGYTAQKPLSFKVLISTSGSGQTLPLPVNEYLQDRLKQACGVTDWRSPPTLAFASSRLVVARCRGPQ